MDITGSIKPKSVTAFINNCYAYAHWNYEAEKFETRIHCGYISDAPTEEEAVRELIRMVHPMHFSLGERMMDSIKKLSGVKAR